MVAPAAVRRKPNSQVGTGDRRAIGRAPVGRPASATSTSASGGSPAPPPRPVARPATERRAPGIDGPRVERRGDRLLVPAVHAADDLAEQVELRPCRVARKPGQAARWRDRRSVPRRDRRSTPRSRSLRRPSTSSSSSPRDAGVGRSDDDAPIARHLDDESPIVGTGAQVEHEALVCAVEDRHGPPASSALPPADREFPFDGRHRRPSSPSRSRRWASTKRRCEVGPNCRWSCAPSSTISMSGQPADTSAFSSALSASARARVSPPPTDPPSASMAVPRVYGPTTAHA